MKSLDLEYSEDFTDLLELVYGPSFLSQGSNECLDLIFHDYCLDGKTLLDIGAGLGGVDFYLAQKHKIQITAIDRVSRLITEANLRMKNRVLLGEIKFVHQETEADLGLYSDSSFDIVFSKESLLHVEDKPSLLAEAFRVLKPGGELIILDWMTETKNLGPLITNMMKMDNLDLKLSTLEDYETYARQCGFERISLASFKDKFVDYTNSNLTSIRSKKSELLSLYGEETYEYSLKSWEVQKNIFETNEVKVILLKAVKPV
jgi:ubiquinone/menaquinone biosynthesis C-methylase UbiE